MTFIIGAALFVVQLAFDITVSVPSKTCSFTPKTTVLIRSSSGGAESITFLAPAVRCFERPSLSLNAPVESITKSTPKSFHGISDGTL